MKKNLKNYSSPVNRHPSLSLASACGSPIQKHHGSPDFNRPGRRQICLRLRIGKICGSGILRRFCCGNRYRVRFFCFRFNGKLRAAGH